MRKQEALWYIVSIFRNKIKNKRPSVLDFDIDNRINKHWLEQKFGLNYNGECICSDVGYELKIESEKMINFGDWTPNYYIYNQTDYLEIFPGNTPAERRVSFLLMFAGDFDRNNRYYWNGENCIQTKCSNYCGLILRVEDNSDVSIIYNFSEDKRINKYEVVDFRLQKENVILAQWFGRKNTKVKRNGIFNGRSLQSRFEDKYEGKGFCVVKSDHQGYYRSIKFGYKLTFRDWVQQVEEGNVIYSCEMNAENHRTYARWESANNIYWDRVANIEIK